MTEVKRSDALWAVSDGRAGNVRQAVALAQALAIALPGWDEQQHVVAPRAPWRWLAPRTLPGSRHAFDTGFQAQLRHAPALAIGCGRQAALATRVLLAHGSRVVQILDPRIDPHHWDLLVVPEHDSLRGANVITALGSLHPVDDAWLAGGRTAFAHFGALPGPRIALLVGGPTAQVPWTADDMRTLLDTLDVLLHAGGSVLATTSRRTPDAVTALLRARLSAHPGVLWCDARDGENPYAGMLGWADAVVCTADSSNLLSEACATAVPVHAAFAARAGGRLRGLIAALRARARLVAVDDLPASRAVIPLRETARVAAEVRARLGL